MVLPLKDNLLHLGVAYPLANEMERQFAPLSNPNVTAGNIIIETAADTLTATGANQAGALALTAQTNRFTTVAAGTGALLPASVPGMEITIINHGANTLQVYPSLATADASATINDIAAATGVPVMVNSTVLFWCTSTGLWYTEGLATGFSSSGSGSFQTFSYQSITASTTHTQAGAAPITAMQAAVTTNNAADAILLPPSQPGMQIDVVNLSGANAMQVYASGSDTINGTAGATGVSQAASAVTLYFCFQAGKWVTK